MKAGTTSVPPGPSVSSSASRTVSGAAPVPLRDACTMSTPPRGTPALSNRVRNAARSATEQPRLRPQFLDEGGSVLGQVAGRRAVQFLEGGLRPRPFLVPVPRRRRSAGGGPGARHMEVGGPARSARRASRPSRGSASATAAGSASSATPRAPVPSVSSHTPAPGASGVTVSARRALGPSAQSGSCLDRMRWAAQAFREDGKLSKLKGSATSVWKRSRHGSASSTSSCPRPGMSTRTDGRHPGAERRPSP